MNAADVIVRQADDLVTARVDEDLVALNIERGLCYGFDAIAARVWELTEVPRSLESLCAQLVTEFEVSETQCRADVSAFLERLESEGLIHVRSAE